MPASGGSPCLRQAPGTPSFSKASSPEDSRRVYADNLALARWLQREIETVIHAPNSDLSLPVVEASFGRIGDASTFWTENILTASGDVSPHMVRLHGAVHHPTYWRQRKRQPLRLQPVHPRTAGLASPSTVNTPVAAQHPKTSTANPAVHPASRFLSRGCECDERET